MTVAQSHAIRATPSHLQKNYSFFASSQQTSATRGRSSELQSATESRHRALLMTTALIGLRARGLRWSDIESPRNSTSVKGPTGSTTLALPSRRRACAPSPCPGLLSALKVWKLACPKGPADLVFPSRTGGVEHHRLMSSGLHAVIAAVGLTDQHGEPKYGLHAPPALFRLMVHQS